MKKLATLGLVGLLGMAGCGKEPLKVERTANKPVMQVIPHNTGYIFSYDLNKDGVADERLAVFGNYDLTHRPDHEVTPEELRAMPENGWYHSVSPGVKPEQQAWVTSKTEVLRSK